MATPSFDVAFISKYWHRRSGFFAVLIPLLLLELGILSSQLKVFAIAAFFTLLVLEIGWRLSRRLVRTKPRKLGFVISVSCDDEAEAAKVRADFVLTLRGLLNKGKHGAHYQVIEIPQEHASKIVDMDEAHALRAEARSHFMIYGCVRVRKINGVNFAMQVGI